MRIRAVRTSVAAALVVMTSAAGVAAVGHASAPAPCGGNTAYAGNGWQAIKVPQLSTIALATGVTYAPDRIYASDGHSTLLRSEDDGCSWYDVSPTAPSLGGSGGVSVDEAVAITAISAPSSSTSASYLYIGANVSATDKLPVSLPSQPYIYSSSTGGRPYSVANSGNGLPAVGSVSAIAASDLAPRTVYTIIANAGSNSGLWASNDAGNSWNGPYSTDTTLTGLRVDPTVSNHLYAVKPGVGVVVSNDGGRTFNAVNRTSSDVQGFSASSGSGSLQLAEGHSSNGVVDLTLDAMKSWRTVLFTGLKARSVAVSPVTPILVAYDDQHLTLAKVNRTGATYLPMTPGVGTPVDDSVTMSAPTASGLAITGIARDKVHLLRTTYDVTTQKVVPPALTPIRLLPHVTKQFPSVLTGDVAKISLPAGGSRDVAYRLLLPRTPSPVDLMFVVDTTDSTDQMIDGVRQGLQTVVNELQSTGLDAQFGLADFKDYPYWANGGGDDHDYPYKLRRKIGPANLTLQTALGALRSADGGDVPESDLAALYYSTTGQGETFGRRILVAPGGDAGYRADALRLAVLATDEAFHTEPDYPGPSWGRTVTALNNAGVHQIGLAVESTDAAGKPQPGTFNSLPDQQRMAIATHSLAPRGGVDCDGDGVTDIQPGGPLVCTISKQADNRVTVPTVPGGPKVTVGSPPPPVHLAPLIVQLAENIPDLRPVSLVVKGAPAGVAHTVLPSATPTVNLRADNTLGYVIRYTCPSSAKAHTWPLTVTARAGARAVTSTHTTLTCGPVAPVAAVAAPAVAIAAGIAPAAPPNPPTNVNANFNPNPAVNPNAGFAQQDEEQPQLALAESDQGVAEAEGQQLAMSRRTADSHTALMLGAAGLMTAGAAGYATRRRWQTASQHW